MPSNQGDVDIFLGDTVATLSCTLDAAKKVDAHFGNFGEAFRAVSFMSLSAFLAVIAAGTGKASAEIEAGVFATGMESLAIPVKSYLQLLANGGRPPKPVKDEAKGAPKNE